MKHLVKLLAVFSAAIIFSFNTSAQKTFEISGWHFTILSNSEVALDGIDGSPSAIMWPEEVNYDGKTYIITTISKNAFSGNDKLKSIGVSLLEGDMLGGANVTTIEDDAFYDCQNLESIPFRRLKKIGQEAFVGCEKLEYINLGGVETLGKNAFYECSALQRANLGNLSKVEEGVFYGCSALEQVYLSEKLTSIEQNAFYGCKEIDTIFCDAVVPPTVAANSFTGVKNKIVEVVIPCESKKAYKSAEGWNKFVYIGSDCPEEVGIENVEEINTISVYPNPASVSHTGISTITIQGIDGDVTIFNNQGQIVKFIKNVKGVKEINIADLESGVYYVKVGDITKKLVVE